MINMTLPPAERYYIGYSGGRDSHVLLDLLCRLRDVGQLNGRLTAIHVNHRLNTQSDDWARHCQAVCNAYGLPLIIETLSEKPQAGDSIEAFARQARYRRIEAHLHAGDVFVSAHHQRDQAETFLLQLMRGAGLDGLRAMPVERPLGAGRYLRPLLSVDYADIVAYAEAQQLDFIDDNSNDDRRFDRNFLRHEILPVLSARFPKACANIAQSAKWLAEVPTLSSPQQLTLAVLSRLSDSEKKQQIRAFVKGKTGMALSQTQTAYILTHHLQAQADKHPTLTLGNWVVRRHAGELCVTQTLPETALKTWQSGLPQMIEWGKSAETPLGIISWQSGQGFVQAEDSEALIIKPLTGSQRFHPHTRQRATTVKKCLHEAGIPAWLRPFYVGIYRGDELLAIPNVGVAHSAYQQTKTAQLPMWGIAPAFLGT